jgi:hypothetical protein
MHKKSVRAAKQVRSVGAANSNGSGMSMQRSLLTWQCTTAMLAWIGKHCEDSSQNLHKPTCGQ